MSSQQPIGIFDSGIGGLTVARAVAKLMPNENIIYFGDTAHLPYGDKSKATIQAYSLKISDLLLEKNCKTILIACHSASTAAYELVQEHIGERAKVINVIQPVIEHLQQQYSEQHIGLIGTRQTINSSIYKKKLDALGLNIKLSALATPLLVPIIEEGLNEHEILRQTVEMYLSSSTLKNIDALILGCTHYPLIKEAINAYYQNQINIIDSADLTAIALKNLLAEHGLLNETKGSTKQFYVSECTPAFALSTELFFKEEVQLEHYPLWE